MDARNIAAWMMEEHQKVDRLADRLREKTAEPKAQRRVQWLDEARERFAHFRAHLIRHMALEEEGGYMRPVLQVRPTLSGQVDRLRHEHAQITEIMNSIHQVLHRATHRDSLLIRDLCGRIERCLSYQQVHEHSENLLVISVFTDEIGEGPGEG